jgi:hypothetical protein
MRLKILAESVYGRRATATFAEAALSYLQWWRQPAFASKVIEHFDTTPLAQVNQDAIGRGAHKIFPLASDATRLRQLFTPCSAILRHAAKRGWCAPLILQRPRPSCEVFLDPLVVDRADIVQRTRCSLIHAIYIIFLFKRLNPDFVFAQICVVFARYWMIRQTAQFG